MKKCNTCGIIAHPHKDFYPSPTHKNVCKRCRPAIRDLYYKNLVSRISGNSHLFTYSETEIFLILDASKQKELKYYNKSNNSLKYRIKNTFINEKTKHFCTRCKAFYPINTQPKYILKKRICHKCHIEYNRNHAEKKMLCEDSRKKKNEYQNNYIKKRLKEDSFFKFQQS